jgi:mycofactocin precursor
MERDTEATADTRPTGERTESSTNEELADELLIEEISIDGMCGVY